MAQPPKLHIGQQLYDTLVEPMAKDFGQVSSVVKGIRDQYPTADSLAGIYPPVSVAQIVNDATAQQVGVNTAINAAGFIPIMKNAVNLSKVAGSVGRRVKDVPRTAAKDNALHAIDLILPNE